MKHFIFIAILVFGGFAIRTQAQSLETVQYFDSGIRALERSQPQEALEHFNKSLRSAERSHTSPKFRAKIHYNIGVSLLRLDRIEDAIVQYDRAIKLSPGGYQKASIAIDVAKGRKNDRSINRTETSAKALPR